MKDKIAVVTPVYNGEDSIQRAIDSLLAQTFKNWVHIIVNDGSSDNTRSILEKYIHDSRFIIIDFKKNKGRPYARQAALEKVKKLDVKYMAMLDGDDWYYQDKLEFQYQYMQSNPAITLMSMSLGITNTKNELIGVFRPWSVTKKLSFNRYENYQAIPHASSIIRVGDIGNEGFDMNMKLGQDQDFLRRLLIGKQYSFIPKISYIYSREESFSFKKYNKSLLLKNFSNRRLKLPNSKIYKIYFYSLCKSTLMWIIIKCNLQKYYFKYIYSKPSEIEISNFMRNVE